MTTESRVQFSPKWKEELVGTLDGNEFTIELTMGVLHVYFPSKTRWETSAPEWAKTQWERVKNDLTVWCAGQKIPLAIEDNAWVEF